MQDLTNKLMEQVLSEMDLSKLKPQVEEVILDYFKSEDFKDELFQALGESGLAYEFGESLGDALRKQLKKAVVKLEL